MAYRVREYGWISDNPCLRLLREECKNSRNGHLLPVVLLAITTGMRQGEILGLTWDCIDLDRKVISLKETKNGHPRTVSIVGEALEILRSHYLKRLPIPIRFSCKKRDLEKSL